MKDNLIEYDSMKLLEHRWLFVDKHQWFYLLIMTDDDGVLIWHEDNILYNEVDVSWYLCDGINSF